MITSCRLAAMLAVLLLGAAAPAQDGGVEVRIEVGFGGVATLRGQSPVTLVVTNRTPATLHLRIALQAGGAAGTGDAVVAREVEISAGAGRQVTMLADSGTASAGYVQIRSDKRERWTLHRSDGSVDKLEGAAASAPLLGRVSATLAPILAIGPRANQLRGAMAPPQPPDPRETPAEFLALDAAVAPDTWLAYDAFRTIAWTEPDPAAMADPAQRAALLRWVQFGGRLVLLAAARPEALEDEAFRDFVAKGVIRSTAVAYPPPPGTPAERWTTRGRMLQIVPGRGFAPYRSYMASWLGEDHSRFERRFGEGTLVIAGFDPFAYDIGSREVFAQALGAALGVQVERGEPAGYGPRLDAATSAGESIEQLLLNRNVLTPPLGLYLFLGLVFVVLIGPFDYVMLKRRNKLHWSPLTLLGYTLLFAGACFAGTFYAFAPDEQINCFALVDFSEDQEGAEWAHGVVMHGIYTPLGGRYPGGLEGCESFGTTQPWWSQSRSGLSVLLGADEAQDFRGPGAQPAVVDLGFNSFRSVLTRFGGRAKRGVAVRFKPADGTSGSGELTVQNGLATPLANGRFVWKGRRWTIPTIAPGASETLAIVPRTAAADSRADLAGELSTVGIGQVVQHSREQRFEPGADVPPELARGLHGDTLPQRNAQDLPAVRFTSPESPMVTRFPDAYPPWVLSPVLDDDHGMFLATTTSLPVDDALAGRAPGFTFAHVRRLVHVDLEKN